MVLWVLLALSVLAHAEDNAVRSKTKSCTNPIMGVYQEYISPVDGDRCRMFPSCSNYASDAFQKHGVLMGWIMTCDRLVRCGRDEVTLSGSITKNQKERCHDPVYGNDFWWQGRR